MCLHLASKGDHRSLVSVVEKWAEGGEPTVAARLAGARALLELRMVDKAVSRIRDLAEKVPPHPDALLVVAESHLLRGWNREARKVAERGLELRPDHPGFRALLERAAEAPTNPDEEAIEPDSTAPAELVRVAEHQMATGALVRARALLERVRRKVPDHRWARDLLWAMDGEYTNEGSLAELCERLGPEFVPLPEVGGDEPEHTESGRGRAFDAIDDRRPTHAFPALFRGIGAPQPEDSSGEPEVTMVSAMARQAELLEEAADKTDPGGDDTQIVRILKAGGGGAPRPDPDAQDTAVNLADLRAPPARRPSGDYAVGDDEDDALIVHTRREDSTEGPNRDERDGFTEELALEKRATAKGAVEDAHWAATPLAGAPRQGPVVANAPHRRVDAASGKLASKAPPATATPVPAAARSRPVAPAQAAVSVWVGLVVALFALAGVAFVLLALVLAVGS